MHADVPDAPLLLHLPQDGEVRRHVGAGPHHDQVDLGHLERRELLLDRRSHGGGVGLRRRAGVSGQDGDRDGQGRRPEELVLNPELVGSRAGALLPRRPAVQHVDDFAAVVEQRLEDLLDRGDIRGLRRHRGHRGPRPEADDREHLTGRRNGPLNELSARLLLKCAEQLRRERQRSAGAGGDSEEFATIDHEGLRLGLGRTA